MTSCEYASRVIRSAPSRSGARRPEKSVTARSKLPQKKWTGLALPMKRARNSPRTRLVARSTRQKRCAHSGSYDAWTSSFSNGIGFGTSTGVVQMGTSIARSRSIPMSRAWNLATDWGTSGIAPKVPSLVVTSS